VARLLRITKVFRLIGLRRLTRQGGALHSLGWFTTQDRGAACDGNGNPIPWISYPAISFLDGRVNPALEVFEFGSGNSTIWWASRAGRVISCEHDSGWAERVRRRVPANVEVLSVPLDDGYPLTIGRTGRSFDIAVIDGRMRVASALASLESLKPGGVLIWDDTDRERYQEGIQKLLAAEFRKLDFVGLSPITATLKQTSVFYKDENCLGI